MKTRLDALTSLRFFAAASVLVWHFERAPAILKVSIGDVPHWFTALVVTGAIAPSFFFVLSGFILVYTASERPKSRAEFWRARFARIYPAYALSLLIFGPQFFLHFRHSTGWIAEHTALLTLLVPLLLQAWVPPGALAWNGVAWSVSVEVFFYALFPFLFARLSGCSRATVRGVFVGACAVSFALPALYLLLHPDGIGAPPSDELFWFGALRFNPLARLPEFVAGMTLGFLHRGTETWSDRASRRLVIGGAVVAGLVIGASPYLPFTILPTGLLTMPFAAIIFGIAMRPRIGAFLTWRPLVRLGNASYSFYLFHIAIVAPSILLFRRFCAPSTAAHVGLLVVVLVVASAMAWIVHIHIEERARKWITSSR